MVQLSSLMRKEAAVCEIVCERYRVVIAGLAGPKALLRDHTIPFNTTYTRTANCEIIEYFEFIY